MIINFVVTIELAFSHNISYVGKYLCVCVCSVVRGGVTAAALEEYGPGLVAHCIAKWFVDNKIPAEFIARLPSDPHDLPDGGK